MTDGRGPMLAALFPPEARPVAGSAHERYVLARLAEYEEAGGGDAETLAGIVDRLADERPRDLAFVGGDVRMDWATYRRWSDELAGALNAAGVGHLDRVAVLFPDGPLVHAAFVAVEKAGAIVVGIGPRSGPHELAHLLVTTGATALLSAPTHRDLDLDAATRSSDRPIRRVTATLDGSELRVAVDGAPVEAEPGAPARDGWVSADQIFLINSTSGTTGLPKCVTHTQHRWRYFHQLAVEAGELTSDDVFMSVIPAPFGFGVWTAHVTPTLLGAPTVVMDRFEPAEALALIERERVSVLACVSTQFIMMLGSSELERVDLSSLRCMFTGGEMVPYERALRFEDVSGARVLQFYGSNETGALSRTTMRDNAEARLRTAGAVIPAMRVRLQPPDGSAPTDTGEGQAACAGPATCLGYYADPAANAELITDDGWMLTGDLCAVDADGYLRVVGRTSDVIIRGGKNISAAQVEEHAASHEAISHAAAVSMPDPVFGERVCLYVELRDGATLELEDVVAHFDAQGVSKEHWPEHLVVLDALPRSTGGKVAKAELREDIRMRLAAGR